MNTRSLHHALAVALLLGATSMASAQTSPGATTTNAATTAASTPSDAGNRHHMRHAHARMHSHGGSATAGETGYHAALKQCVEGAVDQRDRCIDQAISQYGRS